MESAMARTLTYNNCYTATVVASAPELGAALLMPTSGSTGAGSVVIGYYPVTDVSYGVSAMPTYPVGCTVFCARGYMNSKAVVFIVGLCNNTMDSRDSSYNPRMLYNAEKFTQSWKDVMSCTRLLERMCVDKSSSWIHNHANGLSADALPGDYDILDKQTALGLHVGRFMAQLRGSAVAFVDVSSLDSKVRLVGESVEEHNICMESVRTPEFMVDNQAADVSEAFGVISGKAVDVDLENETLGDDFAIPLYRIQRISGPVAQGFEELVVGWPTISGGPAERHDAGTEPPTLARRRMDYSGEASVASAHSIMSVKTPWVQGIEQLGYGGTPTEKDANGNYAFDDLRTPYTAEASPNKEHDIPEEDDEDAITDAAINKMVDKLLTGAYKEAMVKALQEHGFSVTSSKGSVTGGQPDVELPGGVEEGQQYKLPEYVDVTDPATGRKQRYYSSMSFITQERDGSICICDGYGSEIRLCRGNIYISAALDVIVRPGRDFSSMVPGHLSLNAQGSVTVNSSDAMFVRAVNDLKIAGATGGKGVVTLESWAEVGPDATGLPGLLIRSDSNMSVTAVNDLYVGRNTNSGDGRNKTTVPEASGSIVVDAGGNGGLYARGLSVTVDSGELTAGAFTMNADDNDTSAITGTAITMTKDSLGIFSKYVTMPATLNMKAMEDTVKATLCRGGRRREARVLTDTQPSLWVGHDAVVGSNLVVNGIGKFNGQGKRGHALQAYGIISTTDDAQISPKHKSTKKFFTPEEMPLTPASAAPSASGATAAAETAAKRAYQDWFIAGNRFAFPLTYNVNMTRMPGMVWQERSRLSKNAGDPWHEQYITDSEDRPTACYPGYDIWENATVSARGSTSVAAQLNNGGYTTNAKHQEV